MYKIQTLNEISELGTALFDRSKYTVSKDGGADAVLVRSASMHEAELPENLLAIARAGAGVNNIPTDKCSELGICVFNTPGANANAVKELVIAGLLMASRKITDAVAWAKTVKDKGEEVPKLIEKSKSQFAGPEIKGKTLGVVGLGAIGTLVANAASALGMNVIGADPYLSPMSALKITPKLRYVNSVDELYKECDYVSF
ncbi:MAG: 3-phosphoglycerate dehydrogenase, partial [Oscillospiraceae bacterium]|nr:3-phosphoglycerate dehydrogenase [Oscillospiraceae bacterium]